MTARRIYVLTVHDASLGLAVRPVGVLGLEGDRHHASFLPYSPSEPWRERIRAATVSVPRAVARWLETADGVTFDLVEADVPTRDVDLESAVEALVDELLAADAQGAEL